MGRKPPLSDVEKGKVLEYKDQGLSSREIARRIERSPWVVNNFLKHGHDYGKKKSPGRPRKLSSRQERTIIRQLSAGGTSLGKLAKEPNINVHKSTLSRMVQRSRLLSYRRKKKQPRLTEYHKKRRVAWAKYHVTWKAQWKQVVFSDEKKFNLDGPDGAAYYWHDMRKEEKIFSKRQQGGKSLMVWAGFGYEGKTNIAFPTGRMKAIDYQELLEVHLLPFGERIGGPFWIFQQDNASIHVANSTWAWFLDNGVHVMEWPANSPDLNPMENLWGILCRSVYADGKQYTNVEELKTAIISAWEKVDPSVLQKLVDSMCDRVIKVVLKNGSFTGY